MSAESRPITQLTELTNPSVIMMVGVPGSGKSYIAEQLGLLLDIPVISSDACREEISGDANDQTVSRAAWHLVHTRAHTAIEQQASVIIDGTHTNEHQRRTDINKYRRLGADSVVAWIQTVLETALERNAARDRVVPDSVIRNMWQRVVANPPCDEDGFDFVIKLDNN